jgi:hypothetical protein
LPIAFFGNRLDATIRRFANCKISIYADDHMPRHFHIEGRGFRAVVEIKTMAVRAGNVRKAAEALRWAHDNVALLQTEWLRLNRKA